MTNPGRKSGQRPPDTLRRALTETRLRAGLTQARAAKLIGASLRTWQQWEAGDRGMPPTALELWLITVVADGLLPPDDEFARMWIRPSIMSCLHRRAA